MYMYCKSMYPIVLANLRQCFLGGLSGCFSGCVIAELFTEGIPLFDLSQLLAYRKGHFQTEQVLLKIEDRSVRELVSFLSDRLDPLSAWLFAEKCHISTSFFCWSSLLPSPYILHCIMGKLWAE